MSFAHSQCKEGHNKVPQVLLLHYSRVLVVVVVLLVVLVVLVVLLVLLVLLVLVLALMFAN